MTTAIDLSKLPPPTVVEQLDAITVRNELLADMAAGDAALVGLLPSDPLYKFSESAAKRETLIRHRVNEGALAVMLAYSEKSDLDQIGANFDVPRLLLDAGNPAAIPPIAPTYELDADYRLRIQESFEGLSIAGPSDAYRFHARSSHADVLDVGVDSPDPAEVLVTVLARSGNGTPSGGVLTAVTAALTDQSVRPIADRVTVQAAGIIEYSIDATLHLFAGADPALVVPAAQAAVTALVAARRRVGQSIPRTAILAALYVEGVADVTLTTPSTNVAVAADEAGYCTLIEVVAA